MSLLQSWPDHKFVRFTVSLLRFCFQILPNVFPLWVREGLNIYAQLAESWTTKSSKAPKFVKIVGT
jgi:hypothetical protein